MDNTCTFTTEFTGDGGVIVTVNRPRSAGMHHTDPNDTTWPKKKVFETVQGFTVWVAELAETEPTPTE